MWYGLGISLISLNAALASRGFSPASLFENSEDGAWYDIADTTSMRVGRDGSGGVPNVGDPVGLVLDKSQMEGKTAGTFIDTQPELGNTTAGNWESKAGGSASQSGDDLLVTGVGANSTGVYLNIPTTAGDVYSFSFTITLGTATIADAYIANSSNLNISLPKLSGTLSYEGTQTQGVKTYTMWVRATTTSLNIVVQPRGDGLTCTVSDVSVKHVPGNHLIAPSDAARPVYQTEIVAGTDVDVSGQAELVTNGGFDTDSDWTKGTNWTISAGVASKSPGGAGDISLSQDIGAVAGSKYLISITSTRVANSAFVRLGGSTNQVTLNAVGTETYQAILNAESSNSLLSIVPTALYEGTIDNVSVREVPASAARRHKLVFDGVDDELEGAISITSSTAALVTAFNANGHNAYMLHTNNAGSYIPLAADGDANTAITGAGFGGVNVNYRVDGATSSASTRDELHAELDGSAFVLTADPATLTGATSFSIGGGSTGFELDGDWYGTVLIDRALTAEERANVETLLASRSGAVLT
jgi:hypothetical protein